MRFVTCTRGSAEAEDGAVAVWRREEKGERPSVERSGFGVKRARLFGVPIRRERAQRVRRGSGNAPRRRAGTRGPRDARGCGASWNSSSRVPRGARSDHGSRGTRPADVADDDDEAPVVSRGSQIPNRSIAADLLPCETEPSRAKKNRERAVEGDARYDRLRSGFSTNADVKRVCTFIINVNA